MTVLDDECSIGGDSQRGTAGDGRRAASPRTICRVSTAARPTARIFGTPPTAAQSRILDAALELIADHGVSGTSLQMIADVIGITKAGVYRQYNAKDDLVLALVERQLGKLEDALIVVELSDRAPRAREMLLMTVIDLAVEERRVSSALQFDPIIARVLTEHPPFRDFIERLYCAMVDQANDEGRLAAAMMTGAISVAVAHPLSTDMEDDTLRSVLLKYLRRFTDLGNVD